MKEDVQQAIENVLDYQEYMYSYYGLSFDRTDADSIASAQDSAIDGLIEEAVINQKNSGVRAGPVYRRRTGRDERDG